MSAASFDPEDGPDPRSADMLRRISEALGIDKATFLNGANTEVEIDNTVEMLRIWNGLEHAADRRKILAFARAIVAARQ